ncbi:MAG: hypothetical protein EOO15_12060 [Chitinophagaceae bacterium]|nr:MAG: hypothetical protein EOO15_12060 [Chitinophagaceae bacterium]
MRKLISLLLVANALLQGLQGNAQDDRQTLPDKAGVWDARYVVDEHSAGYNMTAAEKDAFRKNGTAILEVLHRNPVMAAPKGFDARIRLRPLYPYEFSKHPYNYGMVADVLIEFCEWYRYHGVVQRQEVEPPSLRISANELDAMIYAERNNFERDGYNEVLDAAALTMNKYFAEPQKVKELAPGVVLYRNNRIVITKPGAKAYWKPVTLQDYFRDLLRYWELRVKKTPAEKPVLDLINGEWAALSPVERTGIAYGHSEKISGVSAHPEDGPRILAFDQNFFTKSKGRTALQVFVIENVTPKMIDESLEINTAETGAYRAYQFLSTLDFAALQSLLQ